MKIDLKLLKSEEVSKYLNEIAHLRITVFREFPYLYDGDLEYEKKYLDRYIKATKSLVVLAFHQSKVIGASTCNHMLEEDQDFQTSFLEHGLTLENTFYFGESIILPKYRGHGTGKKFFELREAHAQELLPTLKMTCFCAVNREGHDLTPKDYRPLNSFWNRMGYHESKDLKVYYPWKDIDKPIEDNKEMVFWIKKWK